MELRNAEREVDGHRDDRYVVYNVLLVLFAIGCITLGITGIVPKWLSFAIVAIVSILVYRYHKTWDKSGSAPLWYCIWRRLWCGFAGAVDGAIAALLLLVILSSDSTWDDVMRAALIGGVCVGAVGVAFPRVIETIGFPLY